MTESELDAIEARAKDAHNEGVIVWGRGEYLIREDIPALVAEVRRQSEQIQRLEDNYDADMSAWEHGE